MLKTARETRKLRHMPNLDDLPDDVAALKAMLAEARASAIERELEIEQLRHDIAESDLEITRLKLLIGPHRTA